MAPRWQPLPGERPEPRPLAASLGRLVPAIFTVWDELVGPSVAEHARPRSLERGTLVVAVDDPSWATQLRWLEADLLVRMAEVLGPDQVARIEVRVRGTTTPGW
jgi:predicted nucleic acid-binding Zn ribbon protein